MSNITEEDVMKYCYSRNLMLVTKESLEHMHRPIVIETMNKSAIPIEWIKDKMDELEGTGRFELSEYLDELLADWEKENEKSSNSD